jgi:hypothetical protein
MWLNSCAYVDMPELSACVDEPCVAFGQMFELAAHDVHST